MTKKLLLADDSITIQKVIGIIFSTEDYQLLVTDNGEEAFSKALEEQPDLVIADISMPGKDGFELCEAIKSDSRLATTSVMLLPGTFDHFDEERAQAVGADGWLTKPFESQALLGKVEQLLAVDPIRLAGEAPIGAAEPLAEFVAAAVEEVEAPPTETPILDEAVLGLDAVDAAESLAGPLEESPEDIWDAVSFADDDLSGSADPVVEVAADHSFADFSAEDLVAEELQEEKPLELDELTVEESVAEDLVAAELDQPLQLETEEQVSVEEELLALQQEDEVPLELVGESVAETAMQMPDDPAAEELEPLALTDEDVAVESSESAVGTVFVAQSEPVENVELTAVEDADFPLVELLDEESLAAEEEILDLVAEDILEEEPSVDVDDAETLAAPEPFKEVAEEVAVPFFASEPASNSVEFASEPAEEEPAAEAVGSLLEEVVQEEIVPEAEVAEDEGFYFEAEEAAATEVAEVVDLPEEVIPVAAVPLTADGSIEQVEQQLRQLSEDELKEVVAKVAGPIIEKLAEQMLEQIAWEVVPDLAESMIREEIRKIKQAEE